MTNHLTEGSILLIDKPYTWTSFDVVNKIRCIAKQQLGIPKLKIGHAGTLDPLATGLLIICTGKFTKRIDEFLGLDKEYTGQFYLGATRPSFDLETEIDQTFDTSHLSDEVIFETSKKFIGDISQKPPIYSAKQFNGRRLYEHARAGESIEIPSKIVHIELFEITSIQLPIVEFRIICSKGTYIRSLADDFGKALSTGTYLNSLRRTSIGSFSVEDAVTLDQVPDHLLKIQNAADQ